MSRVLHIEDDPRNRLLVRKLLTADGHDVIDAADGLEGVRLAISQRPDLVLVDLNIPGLDGYEVTLRLRSEAALMGVPMVAITAEGDWETSFAVGCDGFVQKPIDARNFARQMRQYLGGHREPMLSSADATGERLRMQSQRIVAHLEEKVAELSSANERLRDMDRLRTEFYRNISHELATPLTPIVGYLRMMADEELGEVSKPQMKALRAMDDCVRRLRGILDNLIDVTSLETGRMRFFHREYDFLDTVRRAVASQADKFAERRITLLEETPRGPLPGYGDSERLGRAICQVLDNAAKFAPEGGTVGVRVRVLESSYELLIADNGAGIAPDRAERVFEPFYQVDGSPTRAHGGVGVGLAIVRKVARGLGGDARVTGGATVEGAYLAGGGGEPHRGEAGSDDRRRFDELKRSGREGARAMAVYLDWNATTPPLAACVEAMAECAREAWGTPASIHGHGRKGRARVEDAREAVAQLAGVDPRDVVLTSGGTEANNLALRSAFDGPGRGGTLVTSRLEHPSVVRVAEALGREGSAQVRWLAVREDGRVDLEDLVRACDEANEAEPRAFVLALQAVNHETGVVQPVEEASAIARKRARGAVFVHVDAVQAFGRVEGIAGAGADTRSLAGHKLRGPKGIGALVVREGLRLVPFLLGGAQERGIRPGTVDPVAAAGLAVAARHAKTGPARYAALAPLRDSLERALLSLAPGARVNGEGAARAARDEHLLRRVERARARRGARSRRRERVQRERVQRGDDRSVAGGDGVGRRGEGEERGAGVAGGGHDRGGREPRGRSVRARPHALTPALEVIHERVGPLRHRLRRDVRPLHRDRQPEQRAPCGSRRCPACSRRARRGSSTSSRAASRRTRAAARRGTASRSPPRRASAGRPCSR